jgi:hypothetical protein
MLAFSSLAWAAPAFVGHVGLETTLNEPYITSRGLAFGVGYEPSRRFGIDLDGSVYPNFAQSPTDVPQAMYADLYMPTCAPCGTPDSDLSARIHLRATWWAVSTGGERRVRFGVFGGLGGVGTDSFGYAIAWNASVDVGLQAEAWRGPAGLRVQLDQDRFLDGLLGTNPEEHPVFFGAAFVGRIGG